MVLKIPWLSSGYWSTCSLFRECTQNHVYEPLFPHLLYNYLKQGRDEAAWAPGWLVGLLLPFSWMARIGWLAGWFFGSTWAWGPPKRGTLEGAAFFLCTFLGQAFCTCSIFLFNFLRRPLRETNAKILAATTIPSPCEWRCLAQTELTGRNQT